MPRHKRSIRIAFLVLNLIAVQACVSVSLETKKQESAHNVSFKAPAPPFTTFSSKDVDSGWKNLKNNTSISFHSICHDDVDTPLEGMQQAMINGIEAIKIVESTRVQFNEREALNSVVEGKIDGVPTKIELMLFKKNFCNYSISYVALAKTFELDRKVFKDFLRSFEAP